ncbi:MAG: nucleotide-diphospho-sugar transferase, partial [archaeon]
RKARPKRLYVACDGPRVNRADDLENVSKVRDIVNNVDWDCKVKYLFRKENLGCGRAVSEAITWFFEHEEMGIILEDDCLPDQSFFPYCDKMLHKYADIPKVGMISGSNYFSNFGPKESDCFFSNYYSIWGWATWRRAWKKYDYALKNFDSNKDSLDFGNTFFKHYFLDQFKAVKEGKIDTWDLQWVFCCVSNNLLSIVPNFNLINNIGFSGAHASGKKSRAQDIKLFSMPIEIRAPKEIKVYKPYENKLAMWVLAPIVIKGTVISWLRRFNLIK